MLLRVSKTTKNTAVFTNLLCETLILLIEAQLRIPNAL